MWVLMQGRFVLFFYALFHFFKGFVAAQSAFYESEAVPDDDHSECCKEECPYVAKVKALYKLFADNESANRHKVIEPTRRCVAFAYALVFFVVCEQLLAVGLPKLFKFLFCHKCKFLFVLRAKIMKKMVCCDFKRTLIRS